MPTCPQINNSFHFSLDKHHTIWYNISRKERVFMSIYSTFSEEKKQKMREAHKRWAKEHPRSNYYTDYDKKRSTENKLYRSSKARAIQAGQFHTITQEDIVVPVCCPICNTKLRHSDVRGGASDSPTLDKIIPENGYVRGNVAVICKLCNSTKGSGTAELHRRIADYIDAYQG